MLVYLIWFCLQIYLFIYWATDTFQRFGSNQEIQNSFNQEDYKPRPKHSHYVTGTEGPTKHAGFAWNSSSDLS